MFSQPKLFNAILAFIALVTISGCKGMPIYGKDVFSKDNYFGYYKVGNPYVVEGKTYYPKVEPDYDEYGIASWYGPEFHNKLTANGDTFDQYALTAAHKTLPLPAVVRVTNLENKKSLVVLVNDRGPFSRGRIIDVSKRSAELLGFKDKGIARVRVQFMDAATKRLLTNLPEKGNRNAAIKDINELLSGVNDPQPLMGQEPIIKESTPLLPQGPIDMSHQKAKQELPKLTMDNDVINSMELEYQQMTASAAQANHQAKLPTLRTQMVNNKPAEPDLSSLKFDTDTKVANEFSKAQQSLESANKPMASAKEMAAGKQMSSPTEKMAPSLMKDAVQPHSNNAKVMKKAAPKAAASKQFFIQAGTYGIRDNAMRTKSALTSFGDTSVTTLDFKDRSLYRVRVGPLEDAMQAKMVLKRVIKLGYADALLVKE